MAQLKHRTSNTRALFRGPEASLEQEYMAEDEQEEYIESLRISNERANNSFKASTP
ncbi:hypothetical protein EDD11_006997 [Mortierella claussenii]|nr:hypothetical protein EDD11_006997 [Mortierella claussenii]